MSRLFGNLPSVNDLLDSPPLKGLLDRMGKHRVVAETTRYLDRLRVDAQAFARQALQATPQELAQRVARWIASSSLGPRSVVNATGVLLSTECDGPPLAVEAIDAWATASAEYQSPHWSQEAVSDVLGKAAGYEAALVFTSPLAALAAITATLSTGREIVIARTEVQRVGEEPTIADIAALAGGRLKEVGAVNQVVRRDYEQAIGAETGFVLHCRPRVQIPFVPSLDVAELSIVAREAKVPLVMDLGYGGFIDGAKYGLPSLLPVNHPSVRPADIVLMRGRGLLGGPDCGVLLGRRDLLQRIRRHASYPLYAAGSALIAALMATVKLHEDPQVAEQSIPLLALLATPLENLHLRAERMAFQMSRSSAIEPAVLLDSRNPFAADSPESLPSWGIALRPRVGTPEAFATALRQGTMGILTKRFAEGVVVDLRCVAPKHDISLVDAVLELGSPATEEKKV